MAIIQFADGQKVEFDGNPTPADVEHVASQIGVKSSASSAPSSPAQAPLGSNPSPWFPAPAEESSTLAPAARTLGNFVPSAYNSAKGVVESLNPVNTMGNIAQVPGEFSSLAKEAGGIGNAALATAKEIPGTAYNALVPQAVRSLIAGNPGEASQAIQNDPVGQIAPLILTGKMTADHMGVGPKFDAGVSTAASPVTKTANLLKEKVSPTPTPEAAAPNVGQVIQGKTKDIAPATRVLSEVDTSKVKTYEDLSNALKDHIKGKLGEVDTSYAENKNPVPLQSLAHETKQTFNGKEIVSSANYVENALGQLQELYQKTNDPAAEARINAVKEKAVTEGLTPTEINGLARQYGTEFGQKAFNKMGDALTSVNAQNYENTRSSLKDTARSFLTTDEAKATDKHVSEAIHTKALVDKMVENVNKLEQRVTERNVIEKLGRLAGTAFDWATLGGPKAFVTKLFFPSNVGLKTLNSLDLQNLLAKNLDTIHDLTGSSADTLASKVYQMITSGASAVNNSPELMNKSVLPKKKP